MTPKTPAEQHLEVIEDAERIAETIAAAIKRDRRINGGAIPLPPSRFDQLREAMVALGCATVHAPPNGDGRAAVVLRNYTPDELAAVTGVVGA